MSLIYIDWSFFFTIKLDRTVVGVFQYTVVCSPLTPPFLDNKCRFTDLEVVVLADRVDKLIRSRETMTFSYIGEILSNEIVQKVVAVKWVHDLTDAQRKNHFL